MSYGGYLDRKKARSFLKASGQQCTSEDTEHEFNGTGPTGNTGPTGLRGQDADLNVKHGPSGQTGPTGYTGATGSIGGLIYDSIIRMNKLQHVVPLMYNSNIGTTLLGYKDKKDIQKFLRAEPIDYKKPLTPLPIFEVKNSSGKDFDNWKKSVILWYKENDKHLPSNVIDKDKMIDMVYKQFVAYRTKPTTIESRLDALENKVDQILKKIS